MFKNRFIRVFRMKFENMFLRIIWAEAEISGKANNHEACTNFFWFL